LPFPFDTNIFMSRGNGNGSQPQAASGNNGYQGGSIPVPSDPMDDDIPF